MLEQEIALLQARIAELENELNERKEAMYCGY
jgi:uncharacterized small protein (DUF1192 family)